MTKYIKTECGKAKYDELEKLSSSSLVSKLRFYLFCILAMIRDIGKHHEKSRYTERRKIHRTLFFNR